MLTFGKSLTVLIAVSALYACGYKSPNSEEFPHKHIQQLTPNISGIELKWFNTSDDINRKAINENFIIYSCPESDVKQKPVKNFKICTYDLNHDQQIQPHSIAAQTNQFIDQMFALNHSHFLITIKTFQSGVNDPMQAYLFNAQTQNLTALTSFSYTAFSQTILEQMVQEKTYQKKVLEYGTTVYFDPQYISAKEAAEAQEELKQQQQSVIENFKDIFRDRPEEPKRDFSPDDYRVQPAEPFNLKLIQQLKLYLQQYQAECYLMVDPETQLLKTPQSYIYGHDFSQFLPQLEKELGLSECKKPAESSPVNAKYLKYQSIDDVKGSGNHYVFWFTPIGYDVFEIKQHGQNKQFKLPIDSAWIYQSRNKLIIIYGQTYFVIPLS
ncbi:MULTISPECIES: hypothetical protein [Acinetobacter]|uniref:hypothetical protein n=1 Tax=Acinetobacter TaxID=469 RepID=UPI000D00B21C|nr:hypothetical protein [Acinetobacter sp. MYb10]QLD60595.1 hypothetical protein CQZ96_004630 [Acinetobacter sp. MYb10]